MPLTHKAVNELEPREGTDYSVCDYDGLYIKVCRTGRKKWEVRTKQHGQTKKKTLGEFPEMSLLEARQARDELKRQIKADPTHLASMTFQRVAEEYMQKRVYPIQVESHAERQKRRLELHVYPYIGNTRIADVTAPMILNLIRKIENGERYATAHKVLNLVSQIFRYGVAIMQCQSDPTQLLKGALIPIPERHFATITEPNAVGALLRAVDTISSIIVRNAILFLAYTFVRPGELRKAEWDEIDFVKCQWKIPAEKMKRKRVHIVPLSLQAMEILKEMLQLRDGSPYVFHALRNPSRPMSDGTIISALRRLGYDQNEMSGHGFRALASTNLNELGWPTDAIELQLSHADDNTVRSAYNYAQQLGIRAKMMQAWADWLDKQKAIRCYKY